MTACGVIGAAIGGGITALGALFIRSTSHWPVRSATQWVALCRLAELEDGAPLEREFTVERIEAWYRERVKRQVYVTRGADGLPVVFSRICTHLGCPVKWKTQSRTFRCACHGGVFDERGSVTAGPPKRALTVLESRIAGEMVEVKQA